MYLIVKVGDAYTDHIVRKFNDWLNSMESMEKSGRLKKGGGLFRRHELPLDLHTQPAPRYEWRRATKEDLAFAVTPNAKVEWRNGGGDRISIESPRFGYVITIKAREDRLVGNLKVPGWVYSGQILKADVENPETVLKRLIRI